MNLMKRTKRFLCAVLLLSIGLLCLASCAGEQTPETVMVTVTYDTGGGSPVEPMTVAAGSKLARPSDPVRDSYIFDGWVTESGEKWLFDTQSVLSDMTLVASWRSAKSVFDYEIYKSGDRDAVRLTRLKQQTLTVTVPDSIEGFPIRAVDDGVFAGLSSETVNAIVLSEGVTEIGQRAFADCADINILVKGALTAVGDAAFKGCNALEEIRFAEGLTQIGNEAFSGCGLKEIMLPQSLVRIGEDAFAYCEALQTAVLYGTATEGELVVGDSAFRECGLVTVFFFGDDASRDALLSRVANANAPLMNATFCYYSENEPTESGSFWYWRGDKPRIW